MERIAKAAIQSKKTIASRIGLIDEVRGFAILCMVVYHGFYDAVSIFGADIPAFDHPVMNFIRDAFAFGFIFISGAASRFSRNNLKRGALCFGCGLAMTAVTALFAADQLIVFGILHCLGICMMLFPLLSKLCDKVPVWIGAGILSVLFLLTFRVSNGYLGSEQLFTIALPDSWYSTGWLFWLGLPSAGFYSADYFPLLPWIFAFLLGGYFGRWLKNGNPPEWIKKTHLRPLAFVGRHTLWIYLFHQPVLLLLFELAAILMGY